ncbi:putative carboxypeptidase S1 [Lactifluus volemus]|nr:putative carboxypeptidase S1 [Lactifluus volemus]
MFGSSALVALASASLAIASPALFDRHSFVVRGGVNHTVFEHAATGSTTSYVTNSGICETTSGVNQYSGYFSVGNNMQMWFWFFEARSNPSTAPLALWLNGGPGCSSMIGLFQENGPCTFNNVSGSTPVLNPYSWNNVANMLYVDQPIGTGFSYGTDDVTSTMTAAPYVWTFLQAFYAQFPTYQNRNFGLFTESYGGHYGPEFASYFESQNSAIDQHKATGVKIPLVALGINNGWFDAAIQFKAFIDYSLSNPYRALISNSQAASYLSAYNKTCLPALNTCSKSPSDSHCSNADGYCVNDIENPIVSGANFDPYYIPSPRQDPYPPKTYITYLQSKNIMNAIGAQVQFKDCSNATSEKFSKTGDSAISLLSTLSEVVQSGIQVLIWAGDADWICNIDGVQTVVSQLTFPESTTFNSQSLVSYNVSGVKYGMFKTAGKLSFLNVLGAGHEVPAYRPAVSLQAFTQTMNQKSLYST